MLKVKENKKPLPFINKISGYPYLFSHNIYQEYFYTFLHIRDCFMCKMLHSHKSWLRGCRSSTTLKIRSSKGPRPQVFLFPSENSEAPFFHFALGITNSIARTDPIEHRRGVQKITKKSTMECLISKDRTIIVHYQ